MHAQQRRNNTRSMVLLLLFPCLVVVLSFLVIFLFTAFSYPEDGSEYLSVMERTMTATRDTLPLVLIGVFTWFFIAYFVNTSIIRSATGAKPLERKDNKRVYNLVENLCMSQGMPMPKVNVIFDDSLNAFASGINKSTYTVTLSSGIIAKLDDEELEGVIAHELSHIRNRDVRLLIISIVFVGIFSMIAQLAARVAFSGGGRRSSNSKGGGGAIIALLIIALVAVIGLFFASLMRFAISRKREYLADASAAEMTHKPLALASALRKISNDPDIEAVTRADVAQLFIEHPMPANRKKKTGNSMFATHPPIKQRIAVLEQF